MTLTNKGETGGILFVLIYVGSWLIPAFTIELIIEHYLLIDDDTLGIVVMGAIFISMYFVARFTSSKFKTYWNNKHGKTEWL